MISTSMYFFRMNRKIKIKILFACSLNEMNKNIRWSGKRYVGVAFSIDTHDKRHEIQSSF